MKLILFSLIFGLLFASCTDKSQVSKCEAPKLFEDYWQWQMEANPLRASSKGWGKRHNTFFENTPENYDKIHERQKSFYNQTQSLLKAAGCENEVTNLSLMAFSLKSSIDGHGFKNYVMPFASLGGPHTQLPQFYKDVPLKTLQNYQDYNERLSKVPEQFEQAMALARMGVKLGLTPPKVTFHGYESTFLDLAKGSPEESPFFTPFQNLPTTFTAAQKKDLRLRAAEIISKKIQPAYIKLHKFWVEDYYPKLRETIAAKDLPNGEDLYNYRVRQMTTLDLTAKQIHELGLSEVRRILQEMEAIKQKVNFKGSLKEFFASLRSDPRFYAKSEDELMRRTSHILKTMDGKLPKLFKVLPRLPYGVEAIPSFIADKSPAAYYQSGDMNIGKAGTYQLNTSNLKSRPFYNLPALSLHEAVPGHHLQIALAKELEGLPEFRKEMGTTAFVEGWGLYAESLGSLVGIYDDPYDDFGRLTYEQWRAMRLVVDTGIHAFGWSRDKAIDFMKANSGLSEKNIISEVDRYINWPGQALAYKMGELKIKELRSRAEEKLGSAYDIREFHHQVLKEGAIPLPVLEMNIDRFIQSRLAAPQS